MRHKFCLVTRGDYLTTLMAFLKLFSNCDPLPSYRRLSLHAQGHRAPFARRIDGLHPDPGSRESPQPARHLAPQRGFQPLQNHLHRRQRPCGVWADHHRC